VHCDAGPTRHPNRPFGFGCGLGVVLAVKHRLNRKPAAMDASPDEGQSRSSQALKIKEKKSTSAFNTGFTECSKHPDRR
jgi:hypothetical protein